MCIASPSIPTPSAPAMQPVKPVEALKQVQEDVASSRDQALRRMAARASLASTVNTSNLGLSSPVQTTKTLLGQ